MTVAASEMVEAIERALAETPIGVVRVTVDGTTVQYDREKALQELALWQSKAKPRLSSIDLSTAW